MSVALDNAGLDQPGVSGWTGREVVRLPRTATTLWSVETNGKRRSNVAYSNILTSLRRERTGHTYMSRGHIHTGSYYSIGAILVHVQEERCIEYM